MNESDHPEKAIQITFQPDGLRTRVPRGTTITQAARAVGIDLEAPCGGKGKCGKCAVEVVSGGVKITPADQQKLSPHQLSDGFRLACQAAVEEDLVVRIPYVTRFFAQKILVDGRGRKVDLAPNVRKVYATLPKPVMEDQRGDWERVRDFFNNKGLDLKCSLNVLRTLPQNLREQDFRGTFVFIDNELVAVEKGDTSSSLFGVALDIGTTTLVASLIDLATAEPVAVASAMNPQVSYGEDVISRIDYASTKKEGLNELHDKVIAAVNDLIGELCQLSGVDRDHIYELTVVGNTTMNHLFLKISPQNLARLPFVPAVQKSMEISAEDLGIQINPHGRVYTFPNIAGFVGGDTVGVILALALSEDDKVRLAIDIGTNGEIVLHAGGRLLVASTAAGPAFEGARISQGMRATTGAIERVRIRGEQVELEVIDHVLPKGICGSGLIDAVAELLRVGLIDETGRLLEPEELSGKVSKALLDRLIDGPKGRGFILAKEDETSMSEPIILTQADIRQLQLAKGAIATGIKILERELGIRDEDLSEILLAGAFGNFLDKRSAQAIGLIPKIPLERVKFTGNAASAGAKMALLSKKARRKAEEIARKAQHIELALNKDFQEEFSASMFFPAQSCL